MKKLLVMSGFLLFLSGCSLWQKNIDISYEDLRDQFVQQNFMSPLFSADIATTGQGFRERWQLQIKGNDDALRLDLLLRGQKDFSQSGAIGSYFYDVDFLDTSENLPIRGSGDILYIADGGKEYLRTNTTKIDLGTGNAEGVMVQLIVDALSKKWLYIDKPGFIQTWMFSLPLKDYAFLPVAVRTLFVGDFLSPWSQESDAYSVNGSYDKRNQFMPFVVSSGFAFDGTLGTNNDIQVFELDELVVGDRKGVGKLFDGRGNIVIQSGASHYNISWEPGSYGAIHVIIDYMVNDQKEWALQATIRQKSMQDGGLLWAVKGNISLLHVMDYVDLQFQGNYALTAQQVADIRVPTNALLISQFFGDEFGLGALLDQ